MQNEAVISVIRHGWLGWLPHRHQSSEHYMLPRGLALPDPLKPAGAVLLLVALLRQQLHYYCGSDAHANAHGVN
jgi:hypothetical protein